MLYLQHFKLKMVDVYLSSIKNALKLIFNFEPLLLQKQFELTEVQ